MRFATARLSITSLKTRPRPGPLSYRGEVQRGMFFRTQDNELRFVSPFFSAHLPGVIVVSFTTRWACLQKRKNIETASRAPLFDWVDEHPCAKEASLGIAVSLVVRRGFRSRDPSVFKAQIQRGTDLSLWGIARLFCLFPTPEDFRDSATCPQEDLQQEANRLAQTDAALWRKVWLAQPT